jgi:hypothetical protein
MDAHARDQRYWKVTFGVTFLALLGTCVALYAGGQLDGLLESALEDLDGQVIFIMLAGLGLVTALYMAVIGVVIRLGMYFAAIARWSLKYIPLIGLGMAVLGLIQSDWLVAGFGVILFFGGFAVDLLKKRGALKDGKVFAGYKALVEYIRMIRSSLEGAGAEMNGAKGMLAQGLFFTGMIDALSQAGDLSDEQFLNLFTAVFTDFDYDFDSEYQSKLLLFHQSLAVNSKASAAITRGGELLNRVSAGNSGALFSADIIIEDFVTDPNFPSSLEELAMSDRNPAEKPRVRVTATVAAQGHSVKDNISTEDTSTNNPFKCDHELVEKLINELNSFSNTIDLQGLQTKVNNEGEAAYLKELYAIAINRDAHSGDLGNIGEEARKNIAILWRLGKENGFSPEVYQNTLAVLMFDDYKAKPSLVMRIGKWFFITLIGISLAMTILEALFR